MNAPNPAAEEGFRQARALTRHHAKTFYFASRFLAARQRNAAYAIYALCRISDESVDNAAADAGARLARTAAMIAAAYRGDTGDNPLLDAFSRTVGAYGIPQKYFDQLLEGMRMDLTHTRYVNFEDLYGYCYRAAGVVGLIMAKLFGYRDPRAETHAAELGVAMQLTNILRDIKEDYARGRIYLPLEDLERFGVSEDDIAGHMVNDNFRRLMQYEIGRARAFYASAAEGTRWLASRRARFVVMTMHRLYAGILDAIEDLRYDVYRRRAHVSTSGKCLRVTGILLGGRYL